MFRVGDAVTTTAATMAGSLYKGQRGILTEVGTSTRPNYQVIWPDGRRYIYTPDQLVAYPSASPVSVGAKVRLADNYAGGYSRFKGLTGIVDYISATGNVQVRWGSDVTWYQTANLVVIEGPDDLWGGLHIGDIVNWGDGNGSRQSGRVTARISDRHHKPYVNLKWPDGKITWAYPDQLTKVSAGSASPILFAPGDQVTRRDVSTPGAGTVRPLKSDDDPTRVRVLWPDGSTYCYDPAWLIKASSVAATSTDPIPSAVFAPGDRVTDRSDRNGHRGVGHRGVGTVLAPSLGQNPLKIRVAWPSGSCYLYDPDQLIKTTASGLTPLLAVGDTVEILVGPSRGKREYIARIQRGHFASAQTGYQVNGGVMWYSASQLRLIPKPSPLFSVGDLVEITVGAHRPKQGTIAEIDPDRYPAAGLAGYRLNGVEGWNGVTGWYLCNELKLISPAEVSPKTFAVGDRVKILTGRAVGITSEIAARQVGRDPIYLVGLVWYRPDQLELAPKEPGPLLFTPGDIVKLPDRRCGNGTVVGVPTGGNPDKIWARCNHGVNPYQPSALTKVSPFSPADPELERLLVEEAKISAARQAELEKLAEAITPAVFNVGQRVQHIETSRIGVVLPIPNGARPDRVWVKWDASGVNSNYAPDRLRALKPGSVLDEIVTICETVPGVVCFTPGDRVRTDDGARGVIVPIPRDGQPDRVYVTLDSNSCTYGYVPARLTKEKSPFKMGDLVQLTQMGTDARPGTVTKIYNNGDVGVNWLTGYFGVYRPDRLRLANPTSPPTRRRFVKNDRVQRNDDVLYQGSFRQDEIGRVVEVCADYTDTEDKVWVQWPSQSLKLWSLSSRLHLAPPIPTNDERTFKPGDKVRSTNKYSNAKDTVGTVTRIEETSVSYRVAKVWVQWPSGALLWSQPGQLEIVDDATPSVCFTPGERVVTPAGTKGTVLPLSAGRNPDYVYVAMDNKFGSWPYLPGDLTKYVDLTKSAGLLVPGATVQINVGAYIGLTGTVAKPPEQANPDYVWVVVSGKSPIPVPYTPAQLTQSSGTPAPAPQVLYPVGARVCLKSDPTVGTVTEVGQGTSSLSRRVVFDSLARNGQARLGSWWTVNYLIPAPPEPARVSFVPGDVVRVTGGPPIDRVVRACPPGADPDVVHIVCGGVTGSYPPENLVQTGRKTDPPLCITLCMTDEDGEDPDDDYEEEQSAKCGCEYHDDCVDCSNGYEDCAGTCQDSCVPCEYKACQEWEGEYDEATDTYDDTTACPHGKCRCSCHDGDACCPCKRTPKVCFSPGDRVNAAGVLGSTRSGTVIARPSWAEVSDLIWVHFDHTTTGECSGYLPKALTKIEISHSFVPGDRVNVSSFGLFKAGTVMAVPAGKDPEQVWVKVDTWDDGSCWSGPPSAVTKLPVTTFVPGDRVVVTGKALLGTVIPIPVGVDDNNSGFVYVHLDGSATGYRSYRPDQLHRLPQVGTTPVPFKLGDWVRVDSTHGQFPGQVGQVNSITDREPAINVTYLSCDGGMSCSFETGSLTKVSRPEYRAGNSVKVIRSRRPGRVVKVIQPRVGGGYNYLIADDCIDSRIFRTASELVGV